MKSIEQLPPIPHVAHSVLKGKSEVMKTKVAVEPDKYDHPEGP